MSISAQPSGDRGKYHISDMIPVALPQFGAGAGLTSL